jgi:hypothetical protein
LLVIFKKLLVVIPEPSLPVGCQGRFGCVHRELVIAQGEIFVNQFYVLGVFLQHLLECRLEPDTIGSLVIPENGHGHRSIFRPLERKSGHIKLMDQFQFDELEALSRTAAQHQGVVLGGVS